MGKVTYLLGAGASYDSLPTIANFAQELLNIIKRLDDEYIIPAGLNQKDINQVRNVKQDLQQLYNGCLEHKSVDTYAKMLYSTTQDIGYRNAKCSIILFFELYRYFYRKTDKRYDAFFAALIGKVKPRLPDTVNIISWNYDYEFEKAFMKYANPKSDDIHDIYSELNVVHKNSVNTTSLKNNFGIIKVNGTIGFYDDNGKLTLGLNAPNEYFHERKDITSFMTLIINYLKYKNIENFFSPAISFAWEEENGEKKIMTEITNALKSCDALVVIGYSFPNFNRDIDSFIVENIDEYSQPGIYIQDPDFYKICNKLKKFKSHWNEIEFQDEDDLTEFYIPHELKNR